MKPELVITKDGSASLYSIEFDEHYHSIHGALQESQHVFIQAGLLHKMKADISKSISILEIGFGTGLNALLTAIEAQDYQLRISYTAIERYPLELALYAQLNYGTILQNSTGELLFKTIYTSDWEMEMELSPGFALRKCKMNIEDIDFSNQFDLIYFDAFAPSAQPELWTKSVFDSMYAALKPGGILVTYCAKGEVKRTMKSAGFKVEPLPGPVGKREMTRAIKII
ncbi:MAG: tRNA (5-methylaminomethyl-2-thiouridine)(34)-methyltransferase MnmD [Sphingobacteriales bacterium]|nr:tRNA (5-methylaminomethyl-2-thiouridine)(34)-methyltransferase MnmD [Sphingobacteriales bacterium]